jgi:hypothetical protein
VTFVQLRLHIHQFREEFRGWLWLRLRRFVIFCELSALRLTFAALREIFSVFVSIVILPVSRLFKPSILVPFVAVRVKLGNKRYGLQHQDRSVTLEGGHRLEWQIGVSKSEKNE